MGNAWFLLVGCVVVITFVAVVWRFASRRQSLPCPVWLRWLVEMDNPFAKVTRAAFITEHLELKPGMAVVDVGCGPGRLVVPVAQRVGAQGCVVALDIQPGMLERAKEKALEAQLTNVEFIAAGAGEGALAAGQFDRALLVTVLGEIPDREAALREIYRALKPGGMLSVTEMIFDPHYQCRRVVTELACAAGFREKRFYGNHVAFTLQLEKPAA